MNSEQALMKLVEHSPEMRKFAWVAIKTYADEVLAGNMGRNVKFVKAWETSAEAWITGLTAINPSNLEHMQRLIPMVCGLHKAAAVFPITALDTITRFMLMDEGSTDDETAKALLARAILREAGVPLDDD